MPDAVSRGQLVEQLAERFRRARMQHDTEAELDEVTAIDLENAETTVANLEQLGVYPRNRSAAWGAALRHPVVAGALLAVITGIFASILVPALTRVWQDHPRELALKRELVARMSRESTKAVDSNFAGLGASATRDKRVLDRAYRRWRIESAVIGSELQTYFPDSDIYREWDEYAGIVQVLIETLALSEGGDLNSDYVAPTFREHFRDMRFENPIADRRRHEFANAEEIAKKAKARGESFSHIITLAEFANLLDEELNMIASDVQDAEASGFSHGFWIFS